MVKVSDDTPQTCNINWALQLLWHNASGRAESMILKRRCLKICHGTGWHKSNTMMTKGMTRFLATRANPKDLPWLLPFHCRIIHLIDKNDQMLNTRCLHQHSMFSSLATPLKTSLKLAFPCRDHLLKQKKRYNYSNIKCLSICES